MKIYAFPEGDPHYPNNFVAPIRLLEPLKALVKSYDVSFLCHHPNSELELFDADLAIVQRACFKTHGELDYGLRLLAKARRAGIQIVYEGDDHIFCPSLPDLIADSEVDEIDDEVYELVQAHREILALADYVTCPTEPLASAFRALGTAAEVRVIPTALDFAHARWNSSPLSRKALGQQLHIGWSGGSRVGRDLEIMVHDLVEIARRYPQITVVIAGATKYVPLFSEIPAKQFLRIDWVEYDRYPGLLSLFDLALIPMQDHAYNRCKSALKVIDYAAVGVSSICSPVAPFNDLPKILNTPEFAADGEWSTRIEEFIHAYEADEVHSRQLAEKARRQYGLCENIGRIWSAFQEMIGVPLEETVC